MKKIICFLIVAMILSGCATTHLYNQSFNTVSGIQDIVINIKPIGNVWQFEIINYTDSTVKFLISDSSYVGTDGKVSRLIRDSVRAIHSDVVWPDIPIPPNAKFDDLLLRELYAGRTQWDLYYAPASVANTDSPAKFYLVFEIDGEKKTWVCDVKYTKKSRRKK